MLFEWRSEKIEKKKSRRSDSAEVDGRGSGGVSLNDLLTWFFSPWQNHVLHQRLVNPMWLMESLCLNRHVMDLFSSDASSSSSSSSSFPQLLLFIPSCHPSPCLAFPLITWTLTMHI